ncbi:hypothetical protein AB4Z38_25270 [Arthrobacter sp. 2RAF6]|uniref:hypothetical protein n=1 Tax=Arthrobacter sp. 2RAF6 TaxID=3233002 RepID=UPI003F9286CA
MASVALARVSGSVLAVSARSGIIKNGPRAGEEWRIESANVLVADQNVTVVQLPRRDSTGTFENLRTRSVDKGDQVDYLVEVSIYGSEVQARVLDLWPDESDASELAA